MEAENGRMNDYLMYVGTYTKDASKGIYAYRFQASTGRVEPLGLGAEAEHPSFLAVGPGEKFLYAVNELSGEGRVSSFSIDHKTGRLKFMNSASSGGSDPCHLAVAEKWLAVANYGSGTAAIFELGRDGSIARMSDLVQHEGSGPDPKRQQGPHAHSVDFSRDNRFLFVSDLGLDSIVVYRMDSEAGVLSRQNALRVRGEPGSGPRHLSFHPNGRFVYGVNELNSTVSGYQFDALRGALTPVETVSTLPRAFSGFNLAAEAAVDSSGRFLYASNRGHDSIAVFVIAESRGTLRPCGHFPAGGRTPRHFALDPGGKFLLAANQDSSVITFFRANRKTGALTATGSALHVPSPVCIVFAPADSWHPRPRKP